MSIFCDWLTVTAPPGSGLVSAVEDLSDSLEGSRVSIDSTTRGFRAANEGLLHITEGKRWSRVSASGRFLVALRAVGMFRDYLSVIADHPHTVTRLDAARDDSVDAAPVIARLDKRYRDGYAFTRKAVSTTTIFQTRFDGARTGSIYFGTDNSQVKLRAYDKQHEAYVKRGEVLPPTLRWELECHRETGVSLRDAEDPAPLFYRFMSPEFVARPAGVPDWEPCNGGWAVGRQEPRLPVDRLKAVLEHSADVDRLLELADACGPEGRTFLLGLLRRRLFPDAARAAA